MAARYRAGILGCGGIGLKHAAAYARMDEVELVAGADPSDARGPEYEAFGLQRFYADAEEMLARESLDVVSVCTPPAAHAACTIAAAESGVRGILCEKPMAMDLVECDAMIDACSRRGVRLAIGHQRRFGAQFLRGRDLVASGALGEPLVLWGATPGADVMLWGVHWLDMFSFLVPGATPVSVMAQVDVERQRVTNHGFVEDALLCHITYDTGLRAVLECGDLAEPAGGKPREATIRVHGTLGAFAATDTGCWYSTPEGVRTEPVASPFEAPIADADVVMWVDQAAELLRCIEGGREHQCNGLAGRRTIELACAAWESAVSRRRVALPLESKTSALGALWRGDPAAL